MMNVILRNTALLTHTHTHTQVSVLSVTTLTVVTIQSLPREDTGNTPALREKGRERVRRGNRGERGENSPKRAAERRAVGPVQLICILPLVFRGISCYMDGTTPVGVSPRGVAGPVVVVHSHAHSRILRFQDLECLWLLDSSKLYFFFLTMYFFEAENKNKRIAWPPTPYSQS